MINRPNPLIYISISVYHPMINSDKQNSISVYQCLSHYDKQKKTIYIIYILSVYHSLYAYAREALRPNSPPKGDNDMKPIRSVIIFIVGTYLGADDLLILGAIVVAHA